MTHTFLSKDQIRSQATSIFAEGGSSNTSEKYSHIPTFKIIEDMETLGWRPVMVTEVKARKNKGFQKHLIKFRNNDIVIEGKDGDDVYPEILLTNSSDAKNAFRFRAGLYRLVCSNGLVIATDEFADLKIRHFGYEFSELQNTINKIVEKLPLTVDSMNRFKQTQLDEAQIEHFVQDALAIRFGEDKVKHITIDFQEFLKPKRKEDEGTDLWSVFNLVQEKVTSGDFDYRTGSKLRKARTVKNFNQDIELNSNLYRLASAYCLS